MVSSEEVKVDMQAEADRDLTDEGVEVDMAITSSTTQDLKVQPSKPRLLVSKLECKNLFGADVNGLSDPYVVSIVACVSACPGASLISI